MLEELDSVSEADWKLVVCSGKPVSETIIEDRRALMWPNGHPPLVHLTRGVHVSLYG